MERGGVVAAEGKYVPEKKAEEDKRGQSYESWHCLPACTVSRKGMGNIKKGGIFWCLGYEGGKTAPSNLPAVSGDSED